ncbi:uncharacterized protein ACIB01_013808 isoform 2-T2 [Guaruba guarouba]
MWMGPEPWWAPRCQSAVPVGLWGSILTQPLSPSAEAIDAILGCRIRSVRPRWAPSPGGLSAPAGSPTARCEMGWGSPGAGCAGGQEEPRGERGCGVDRHRDALGSDFLPSAVSSGVTCAVRGRGSLGSRAQHHGARPRGQPRTSRLQDSKGRGGGAAAAAGTAEDGAGQAAPEQEDGSCSPCPCQGQTSPHSDKQVRLTRGLWGIRSCSDAPSTGAVLMQSIPAWSILCHFTASAVPRPGGPQPNASDTERGRDGDPDADGFNAVLITTARLSHPTATRPRVPGQRPPSLTPGGPCDGEHPEGTPHSGAGQVPAPPWTTEVPVAPCPKEALALGDLKAEVRSLHILVDLMRVQHLRDLEDLRLELGQERAKRQALQAEIERVRKALLC